MVHSRALAQSRPAHEIPSCTLTLLLHLAVLAVSADVKVTGKQVTENPASENDFNWAITGTYDAPLAAGWMPAGLRRAKFLCSYQLPQVAGFVEGFIHIGG